MNVFKANNNTYGQLIFNRVFSEEKNVPTRGFEFAAKRDKLSHGKEVKYLLIGMHSFISGDGIEDPLFNAADDFIAGNKWILDSSGIDNVQAPTSSQAEWNH